MREAGSVRQKALVVAYAVHETGRREVLGTDVGEAESKAFWREFLRSLVSRAISAQDAPAARRARKARRSIHSSEESNM